MGLGSVPNVINEKHIRGGGEVLLGDYFIVYHTCGRMGLISKLKSVPRIEEPRLQLDEKTLAYQNNIEERALRLKCSNSQITWKKASER